MKISSLKIGKTYKTHDYEIFKLHPENRDVVKIKKIEASMRIHGYIPAYPLHCVINNNELLVKAGHHRLHVAKSLDIDVYFCVCDDDASIVSLEGTPWSLKDYMQSGIRSGNSDFIELDEFCKRTKLSVKNASSLLAGELAGSGNQLDKIKDHTYEIKDTVFAEKVAELSNWLFDHGVSFARNGRFVGALSKFMLVPQFSVEQFKRRALTNKAEMVLCPTQKTFCENMEYIYNKSSREKIPLCFLADSIAKDRSCVKTPASN